MRLEDSFMYQINWNRKKYPEICKALEDAKKRPGGIAWYLRELIQKDLEEKQKRVVQSNLVYETAPRIVNESSKPKTEKIELPDDSGGFL
ncbi:hypothetical protein [Bacillus sp. Bos-x628]|uniref:hypothetical protein n=1 Tax=Bacillus maqinnsis TaxID=3229854 RepID=UPI00339039C3